MVKNVAVLSDVHGVLPALEAVWDEAREADVIVVNGDVAAGPQPVEVLDRLSQLGEQVVWVRGNADRELVDIRDNGADLPIPEAMWAASQLPEDQLALLRSLPLTATLDIEGLGTTLFCHATMRDDAEVVLVDSAPARYAEAFAGLPPEVNTVVCGHTHMPFIRLVDGVQVVNPGSVGMPYGRPGAHWAMLGPGVSLRRNEFDYRRACERIAVESGYPQAAQWAEEYVWAQNSDRDALQAFGPLDGRAG